MCAVVLLSPALAAAQNRPAPNWVRAVEWSPSGDRIAFATQRGTVRILDSTTGELVIELQGRGPDAVFALAWSPDGTQLAAGGQSNATKIWDAATGQVVRELRTRLGGVISLDWSPDSAKIATVSQSEFPGTNVWDLATGELFQPHIGEAQSAAWSPDGTLLAAAMIGDLQLWDVETQQKVGSIEIPGYAIDLAWSHDGTKIASADTYTPTSSRVRLWNVATGELLQEFEGHTDVINSASWNPAEDRLASSSSDGTVRVWDVASGRVLTLYRSTNRVFGATFSPYGGRLAFGGTLPEAGTPFIVDAAVAVYADGAVQIVVPAPSVEQLHAIVAACDAPPAVETSLIASLDAGDLEDVVAQVEALPPDTIPPACAADVIAVAEALQGA
ncbi:MAG TPA: WD40 repeat domain-containing protein [Aggregatilinea sp.]|uniref:WD40 repeat domain-containing protein n=1 Tax=Aggregatilinea sp. TaxID=2806333 RepID=UPI002B51E5D5|nr:WD40 repeat domain-containing protein [Aggregatilinea sp.]HML22851.1 WD40 repeat domain-containing protein [Aggregatilinea sp.]